MSRQVEIEIGKTIAVASFLEKQALQTCDVIWKNLPLKSDLHHAKYAGAELFVQLPRLLTDKFSNPVKVYDAKPGYVCHYPPRQYLIIFYGEVNWEPVDVDLFAVITDNLKGVQEEGRKAWLNPGATVSLRRRGRT